MAEANYPAIETADFGIVLLDGFQMDFARSIARRARERGVPVVLDGGSWKQNMESLLPFVDIAICSADFRPPGSDARSEPQDVLDYLSSSGVRYGAITRGEKPVVLYEGNRFGEIAVGPVTVVDTLGAGDIFHGAFCYYFASLNDFEAALEGAVLVAGKSCGFFGARAWMMTGENSQQ